MKEFVGRILVPSFGEQEINGVAILIDSPI
jgi:hypothetical protein